ncbi:alpha/beta-hydrolase [Hymenopellis radicata]|nr:alpha/beta-hydrolase [Hymenopellis radicata]
MPPEYVTLPDGARLAYEIYGSDGTRQPLVLIGGVSNTRGDWQRIVPLLSLARRVLVFDHRGIGDSTFASSDLSAASDQLTIESMACDLLHLLQHLEWKEIAICGFSMGGVIAQQLVLFPYLPEDPVSLRFRISHILLAGTTPSTTFLTEENGKYGLPFVRPTDKNKRLTLEDKKNLVRPTLAATFDPIWLNDPVNAARFEDMLEQMTIGRPMRTIILQGRAMLGFSFQGLHANLKPAPHGPAVLIIHGTLDAVVPFSDGLKLLELMPHAQMVEAGDSVGQIDSLDFGHNWFEYYEAERWCAVIEKFLNSSGSACNHTKALL